MTYDPTWIRKSPILIPQAVHNEALIGQKGSVRLDALDWGQKVGATTLDLDQQASTALALAPLNNNKMFVAWGAGTDGRYAVVNSDGQMDSTAYLNFETGNFLDYGNGLATVLLPNGNVVVAYGQDQGASNALVFKIYSENGDMLRDATTVKTHATETQWGVGLAALPDGQFVITWEENAAGAHSYFAIYDMDGDVVKGYTSLGGLKGFPQPAPLSDGNWIVTYEATGLRYQTYDRQGIQIVGETLFRSGVSQAAGVRTMANGQIVIPFLRGFGIIDRQGNVVVAPEVKEVAGTYSVTVLPHDNIVAQNNNGTSAYYKIYDSAGNLLNTQVTYATDASPIAAGDVATFKNGNFMLAYVTDASSKALKIYIHEGTKAGFAGDLTVDGEFGLAAGTTVTEISTDGTFVGDSDDALVTEKAAKTYVDAQIGSLNPNRIFQGDSEVIVLDDAADQTSVINVIIDSGTVANYTNQGYQLGGGVRVTQIRNDHQMGGYDGASGSQTSLTTEYAARKYVDDLNASQAEPTGFETGNNNAYSQIGIDSSNVIWVQPTSGSYDVFFQGARYRKTTKESVEISDVEGVHYIYFDAADGVLKETTTFNLSLLYANGYVAVCYWDATNKEIIYFGDERHGCTMDGKTHVNIHIYRGTLYTSGLAVGNITADSTSAVDADAQFSVENGGITDEDISHVIPAQSFPASLPMFYLDGASDWRSEAADNFPVVNRGTGRVAFNELSGATWSLTEATDNSYVLTHVFATNDPYKPVVGIVGQANYTTLESARIGAADEINNLLHGDLPFAEFVAIATVIYETSDSHANTPKAIVVSNDEGSAWTDWRTSGLTSGSASSSDHGNLTGLGNDDHLQYFRIDGLRSVTGNLTVEGTSTFEALATAELGLQVSGGVFSLATGTTVNDLSTDGTLGGNSDDSLPTEQAVKTYVDTAIANLNPDKIWSNDSKVEVVDDGTNAGYVTVVVDGTEVGNYSAEAQVYGVTTDTNMVLNQLFGTIQFEASNSTVATLGTGGLQLTAGTNVNEFSIDGTLAGDSDNAVPTEKAVKTYVDAQIADVIANDNEIHADDSRVTVHDDGTAVGWIEVVADGVQVQYWDAQAASIRMGKASGAGRVTVTDTSVVGSVGATDYLNITAASQVFGNAAADNINISSNTIRLEPNNVIAVNLSDTQQSIGVGGDTEIVINQAANNIALYSAATNNASFGETSQTIGVAGDSRVVVDQTADSVDIYAGATQVGDFGLTTQIVGVAGDARLELNQTADTFLLAAGANTQISGGLTTMTLGVAGDTTITLDQSTDQIAITAGGQSQILVETTGTSIYDDLTVTGDLFVDGTTFVVNQTEVRTADNMITVNYGEPGAGVTGGYAGIEVDRGSLNNYYFVFAENTDTFRVGESADGTSFTDLQAVATREDNPVSMVVPYWNDTEKRFDTAGDTSITINNTTDTISISAGGVGVGTWTSSGLALTSGVDVNEFSTDGTLSGDSDDAVPTEKAVKTYVDAQVGGQSHTIFQGDSSVTVHDDTTAAGYINVIADGVEVANYATAMQWIGVAGDTLLTINPTSNTVSITANATSVFSVDDEFQALGTGAGSSVNVDQTTHTVETYANGELVVSIQETSQVIGGSTDSRIAISQASDTVDIYVGSTLVVDLGLTTQTFGNAADSNIALTTDLVTIDAGATEVFNATPDLQTVGGDDSYITIDQTSGSIAVGANSVEAMTLDENGLQLFTGGATINEFSTDGTLAGDSDTAVPTEKAVKTYVDAQIGALTQNRIEQGDSYVQVIDDQTAVGYVEIVTDGVQVAYFDPSSATQRIGKLAESRMLVADDDITFFAGASPTQQMDITGSGIQLATGERVNAISLVTTLGTSNTTLVTQGAVKSYADTGDTNTLSSANTYADGVGTAANGYTDTQIGIVTAGYQAGDATTLVDANAYTDVEIAALRNELDLINMRTVTADTTAVNGDVILVDTTAGDVNVEMIGTEDTRIIIKKKTTDGNRVNISTSSGTIDGQNLIIIDTPYQSFTFVSDGSNFYII